MSVRAGELCSTDFAGEDCIASSGKKIAWAVPRSVGDVFVCVPHCFLLELVLGN